MDVDQFSRNPTRNRHQAYGPSVFASVAPEYSTGENLLASVYRRLILGVGENDIDLRNIELLAQQISSDYGGRDLWSELLFERGGISSPMKQGQYGPRSSVQLMPLVPSTSRIAGVLGKHGKNRWNPSQLLIQTIGAGVGPLAATILLREVGAALEVTSHDDIFARFAEQALKDGLADIKPVPSATRPYENIEARPEDCRAFRPQRVSEGRCPSEIFCEDLRSLLRLKDKICRRQWTVLLEALLRLGLVTHCLWVCHLNINAWKLALSVAAGESPPSESEIEEMIWGQSASPLLIELGARHPMPAIRRTIEHYAYARTGLNLLFSRLDEVGSGWPSDQIIGYDPDKYSAPTAIARWLNHVSQHRDAIYPGDAAKWLHKTVAELFDHRDLRSLAELKAGYTRNILFFVRHCLGQMQTTPIEWGSYDLGYLLYGKGREESYVVQPGTAMLIMLTSVCCSAHDGLPVSLDDFREHLRCYGIHVPAGELIRGHTGQDLNTLGLLMDSPDAAGGRLLVSPF